MNTNFRLLLSGQLVSQVGDKFHMIALAFWVLETTGSSAKMGVVLAASLIPSLILGLFSGAVIDRYPKKRIIVGTDLIRGGILLCFAWIMFSGQMDFGLILFLQAVLSVNAAFFDPAIPSVIPQIVDKKDLGRANALHQSFNSFAMIGGAALGGLAVSKLGYVSIFILNGFSFLISAGFESLIRIPALKKEPNKHSFATDIREGYSYLLSNPTLMVVLFMVMIIHFFVGGLEVFMPVIAGRISSDGPGTLGIFQAALGSGILAMSLLMGKFSTPGKETSALFSSVAAMGCIQILTWCIPVAGHMAAAGFILCFFLWGCAMIRAAVSFKTLLQIRTETAFSGRVFAMASTIGNASIPAAMIMFGFLLEYIDFSHLLPVSGFALAGVGLISFALFKEGKDDQKKYRTRIQKSAAGSNRGEA